jgi:hypothetical protein
VVVPVGSNVYEVDVVALAELLITLLAVVDVGGDQVSIAEVLLASLSASLFIVAESNNLNTGDVSETHYSPGTTHTETYETYAYGLELGSGEAEYVLLTSGTLGSFNYESTLVPMCLGRGRKRLSIEATCGHQGCQCQRKDVFYFHKINN